VATSRGSPSRTRIRVLLPCAVALTVLAVGAVDAGALGRCRELACHTELMVGSDWRKIFRSPQAFHLETERVSVRLFAAGQELAVLSRSGEGGCRLRLRGSGVVAGASFCGRVSAPLRVAGRRLSGGPIELDVVYRARARRAQGVRGIVAGSGGGVGAPTSAGVGSR